jgi:hypothetical protein
VKHSSGERRNSITVEIFENESNLRDNFILVIIPVVCSAFLTTRGSRISRKVSVVTKHSVERRDTFIDRKPGKSVQYNQSLINYLPIFIGQLEDPKLHAISRQIFRLSVVLCMRNATLHQIARAHPKQFSFIPQSFISSLTLST